MSYRCLGSEIDLGELRHLMAPKPKFMIVNSPHNPTGAVLSLPVLRGIIEVCVENDVLILSDAAYEDFVHDGVDHHDLRTIAGEYKDRNLTTRSFSKPYAMTGFRIGYLLAERQHIDRCAALQTHFSDNVCTFAQFGADAAIKSPRAELSDRARVIEERVLHAYSAVSEFLPCPRPQGGFYLFPRLSGLMGTRWPDCRTFVSELAQATGVRTVPGEEFGLPGHIRLSIAAVDTGQLRSAIDRIRSYIQKAA